MRKTNPKELTICGVRYQFAHGYWWRWDESKKDWFISFAGPHR